MIPTKRIMYKLLAEGFGVIFSVSATMAAGVLRPEDASASNIAVFERSKVFERSDSNEHYRVPKIIQTVSGMIIVAATRHTGQVRDHGGQTTHCCKISIDDGRSWTDSSDYKIAELLDSKTGKLWSTSSWYPQKNSDGQLMTEGWLVNNPKKVIELGGWVKLNSSEDNGQTWQSRDVTDRFFTYKNGCFAVFHDHGIQLQKGRYAGRLIIPARYYGKKWDGVGPSSHNTLIYSDDNGNNWHWGGSSQGYCGEGCVVELSDGSVYLNNRNHDPNTAGYRSYSISRDGGLTFTEFGVDMNLPESKCDAAMVRYSFADEAQKIPGRIIFVNPAVSVAGRGRIAHSDARKNLTARLSYDDCKTWAVSKLIDAGKCGYSDMIVTDKGTVLCVYESGANVYHEDIMLARFNMEWLEDKDSK